MSETTRHLRRDDVKYREAIIKQALHEFHKRGIRGVTMSQISEELHISKRTLYEIYASKEDLIVECLQTKHLENCRNMEAIIEQSNNVMEALLQIFQQRLNETNHINSQFLEELQEYHAAKKYFAQIHAKQRVEAVEYLRSGVAEGVFEPTVDFEIFYDMLHMMVENIFTLGLLSTHTVTQTFTATLITYIRGCATNKGRQIIDNWLRK